MRQTPASERVECSRCGSFVPASDLDRHGVCDDCVSRLSELQRLPPTVPNVVMGALGLLVKLALPALLLAAATSLPRYFLERHGGIFHEGAAPWHEVTVVVRAWIVAAACAMLGLALLKVR